MKIYCGKLSENHQACARWREVQKHRNWSREEFSQERRLFEEAWSYCTCFVEEQRLACRRKQHVAERQNPKRSFSHMPGSSFSDFMPRSNLIELFKKSTEF
jgi:hypothetical protein